MSLGSRRARGAREKGRAPGPRTGERGTAKKPTWPFKLSRVPGRLRGERHLLVIKAEVDRGATLEEAIKIASQLPRPQQPWETHPRRVVIKPASPRQRQRRPPDAG
jgi:hypothetical protein